MGWGWLLGIQMARFIGAAQNTLFCINFSQNIEVLGFRHALETALGWNLSRIIAEGDAKQVVPALSQTSIFDSIIMDLY